MAYQIIEEYITVNSIYEYTCQYIEEGLPVVLFVHGSGTPDSLFSYLQTKDYEGKCSCVFYDQRGAGKTYKKNPRAIPTYEQMQQDLYETILYITEKLHTDQVILVANSLGTIISTPVVLKYPQLISSYIVSGFIPCMKNCEGDAKEILLQKLTKEKNSPLLKKADALADYPPCDFNPKATMRFRKLLQKANLTKPISKEMKKMMTSSPYFTMRDLLTMLKSPEINKTLFQQIWSLSLLEFGSAYQVPIYFLHGEDDIIAPLTTVTKYIEQITAPKKELLIIKKAGHMTGFDNIPDYNAAFLSILNAVQTSSIS